VGHHPPEHLNDPDMPDQISQLPSGAAGHDAVESPLGGIGDAVAVASQGHDVVGWFHGAAMVSLQSISVQMRWGDVSRPGDQVCGVDGTS
jgi:hypothetical protein